MKEDLEKIKQEKKRWEEKTLKPALQRFKLKESPTQFYSPVGPGGGGSISWIRSASPASILSPPGPTPLSPISPGSGVPGESPRPRGWSGPAATPGTEPRKTPGITTCT